MANYIFCDNDGVINSETWYRTHKPGNLDGIDNDIDPKCIERLNRICSETGAYLVMSSDWRYDFNAACKRLYKSGLTGLIIDHTEMSIFGPRELSRGKEIQNWVDQNLTTEDKWCIIDDRTDMIPGQPFFEIDYETGLTDEITDKVIAFFSDSNSQKTNLQN